MTPHLDTTVTGGGLRSYVPHISAAFVFSLVFLGWTVHTRQPESQSPQNTARAIAAQEEDARTLAYYGNGQLKVLSFYADPAENRADHSLVCYGVSNAASVTIEPPLGETWPSTGRCMEATPARDTEYKLTARDGSGHEQIQTVMLRVKR